MERTGATIGAATVRQDFGYDGSRRRRRGHRLRRDALARRSRRTAGGGQRVARFVDFIERRDDGVRRLRTRHPRRRHHRRQRLRFRVARGPASHRARIWSCSRCSTPTVRATSATSSRRSTTSSPHRDELNIRIVNLSVAAGVYESYTPRSAHAGGAARCPTPVSWWSLPRATEAAAPSGRDAYGGITAPGNAPWVLTVGASSHMGTVDRGRRHDGGVQLREDRRRSTTARSPISSRRASASSRSAIRTAHSMRPTSRRVCCQARCRHSSLPVPESRAARACPRRSSAAPSR